MSDPWAIYDDNGGFFAESLIKFGEKISNRTGKPYKAFDFKLTPFNPEKQIITEMHFPNDDAMKQVIVPSLMKLISMGKIKSPKDMEQTQFVKVRFSEYKSRSKDDIKYWKKNDPDRIGTDPHGNYVIKKTIEFLDIYPDQASWQNAAESNAKTSQLELPTDEIPQPLKDSLKTLIKYHFPDMTTLRETVLNSEQFSQFSEQGEFVKSEVVKLIAIQCGTNAEAQEKVLAEINSHYNSDTPYLTMASPELNKHLDEIPF